MNLIDYIKKILLTSIGSTLLLLLLLIFTEIMNPILIKWILFSFFISLVSSGILILQSYSPTLTKIHKLIIPLFGILLTIYFFLILFSAQFSSQIYYLIGLFIIYIMTIQLNILGWSKQKHTIGIKLLFLFSLLSNLFLSSIFFFKIDLYEIKPFLISSIFISLFILMIGVYIHNKRINKPID